MNAFGAFLALLLSVKFKAWNNVCNIKVDLPLPETPVIQVKLPVGIFRLTLFRLFPVAPLISTNLPFFAKRRVLGTSIFFLFDKYWPVILFLSFLISSYVPWADISPPLDPASGPYQ